MKPNILMLTIGRSGSTILTRMLRELGWNLPTDADEYAEPAWIREMNDRMIRGHVADYDERSAAISALPEPWVLKDPRFCWTLKHWREWLDGCLLLWLTRDLESIENSLRRAGWGQETASGYCSRGVPLPKIHNRCKNYFDQWQGPKLQISFEDLKSAVSLFDPSRG